jgi:hypothetical protein
MSKVSSISSFVTKVSREFSVCIPVKLCHSSTFHLLLSVRTAFVKVPTNSKLVSVRNNKVVSMDSSPKLLRKMPKLEVRRGR